MILYTRCRFQQIWSIAKCSPDSSLSLCSLMTLSELPYPESRHSSVCLLHHYSFLQESSGWVWPPWSEWQVQSGETGHQWSWSSGSFSGVQEEGRVYSCLGQAYSFTSIAIESLGACSPLAREFLYIKDLGMTTSGRLPEQGHLPEHLCTSSRDCLWWSKKAMWHPSCETVYSQGQPPSTMANYNTDQLIALDHTTGTQ